MVTVERGVAMAALWMLIPSQLLAQGTGPLVDLVSKLSTLSSLLIVLAPLGGGAYLWAFARDELNRKLGVVIVAFGGAMMVLLPN
jgi:hypothetical protein